MISLLFLGVGADKHSSWLEGNDVAEIGAVWRRRAKMRARISSAFNDAWRVEEERLDRMFAALVATWAREDAEQKAAIDALTGPATYEGESQ